MFDKVEQTLFSLSKYIYKSYVRRFINKEFAQVTPAEYQSKMKDYNLQNKYRDDNANKAYSDWD
jgi:hypothetical protein